jgi:methionyl-tRNA formyltransferase
MSENEQTIYLKTVFFGTGDLGLPSLQWLIETGNKPQLVVTSPDKPAGRGLKLKHSPIKDLALQAGVPVYQPEKVNDPQAIAEIERYKADVGIIIAYGQKISRYLIDIFPHGIINLHAALLPRYRGAAPINWAIINGDAQTGLTAMSINEQIDAGKILNQRAIPIDPLIQADELHDELAKLGPDLLCETILQMQEGTLTPISQDPSLVTKAPKLSKALSPIDWHLPAGRIADWVRGLWSWPTATSEYVSASGKKVFVAFARVQPLDEPAPQNAVPGMILADFTVAAGSGRLRILEVKPSGSKLMKWQDFINGRHVQPGDRFINEPSAQK